MPFDFIGYTRDAEIDITIRHPAKGIYTSLDVRDKHSGFYEHYDITDKEAASCGNIYTHIGIILDKMVARIGAKRAKQYADRHISNQMRAREDFFRGK